MSSNILKKGTILTEAYIAAGHCYYVPQHRRIATLRMSVLKHREEQECNTMSEEVFYTLYEESKRKCPKKFSYH